jgi:hypothetical protein
MGDASKNAERPILNIEGNLVALDPLRWDLLPIYQRWINNLGTMRTLGLTPLPMTSEKEQDWYDRRSKAEDDLPFTLYERETLRPIGSPFRSSRRAWGGGIMLIVERDHSPGFRREKGVMRLCTRG